MEKLRDFVLHPHIHSALERWLEGIRKVQARRKEEIVNATNRHRNVGNRHQEDKGTSGLLSRSVFICIISIYLFGSWGCNDSLTSKYICTCCYGHL